MSDLLHDPMLWFLFFAGALGLGIYSAIRTTARRTSRREADVLRRGQERISASLRQPTQDTIDETAQEHPAESTTPMRRLDDEVTNTAVNEVTATAVKGPGGSRP